MTMKMIISLLLVAAALAVVTSSQSSERYSRDSRTRTTARQTKKQRKGQWLRKKTKISVQPFVTRVEKGPASKVVGSVMLPNGSEWCDGMPTYWLTGHQHPESPWCQKQNGNWEKGDVQLELVDKRTNKNGPKNPNRHACVSLDVNKDGREDLICTVGATNYGVGIAYNEIYLTNENGGLDLVKTNGLQKYPTMRGFYMTKLKHASGADLVFIATVGGERYDRRPNQHRLFKNLKNGKAPYFKEVKGPWTKTTFNADCLYTADVNNDGLDDLIICERLGRPRMYVQNKDGKFSTVLIPLSSTVGDWRNIRVANITNHLVPDLVAVGGSHDGPYYLHIYRGRRSPPYFSFKNPYYSFKLPNAAADVEVLDANKDGFPDIYVLQDNERTGYCAAIGPATGDYWGGGPRPRSDYVPPISHVPDLLFVGRGQKKQIQFRRVRMKHRGLGCGGLLEKFGSEQRLVVSRARQIHVGYNYLYEWGEKVKPPKRMKQPKPPNVPASINSTLADKDIEVIGPTKYPLVKAEEDLPGQVSNKANDGELIQNLSGETVEPSVEALVYFGEEGF